MHYLVFDISNMLYRTFSAHQKSTGDDAMGLAVHTAMISMQKFYKKFKPDKIVACFDRSSWRKGYTKSDECITEKKYKGNRRQNMTPAEKARYIAFLQHIDELYNLLKDHTSIITLEGDKLEADDFIAGFLQVKEDPENRFTIVSSDKDLIQLFRYQNVNLYDPLSGKSRSLQEWDGDVEYFMFEKCIRGDSGDNVQSAYPGVRKTRIRKAYDDMFERENLMHHKWVMPSGKEVEVGDMFRENRLLMDLEYQPEDVRRKMVVEILRSVGEPGKYSHFHFVGFCGKHELKKVSEQAETFTQMLSL